MSNSDSIWPLDQYYSPVVWDLLQHCLDSAGLTADFARSDSAKLIPVSVITPENVANFSEQDFASGD